MPESDRTAFLARFQAENPRTLVGLAVLGGVFGEGIDLMGDRLAGASIVGLGLPAVTPERELIRQHYDETGGEGYAVAYLYPGLTRVIQAAGRVIRSDTDTGAVLLIDDRYALPEIRDLLPGHWRVEGVETVAVTPYPLVIFHFSRFID